MKFVIISVLIVSGLIFAAFRFGLVSAPVKSSAKSVYRSQSNTSNAITYKTMRKARHARDYAIRNGFDSSRCFLLDMSIHSGNKRFFVYNFDGDSVELSGLVTHGSGSERDQGGKKYSNQPNSHCTSLGRYRIGHSYNGQFGLAYKLYGLDPGNSNAFKRFVVLHAHECVPENEVYPMSICLSYGCPTVSPSFLQKLKPLLNDTGERPMLLWIYQ